MPSTGAAPCCSVGSGVGSVNASLVLTVPVEADGRIAQQLLPCLSKGFITDASIRQALAQRAPFIVPDALSQQIHEEVCFATLVFKAQSSINSSTLLKTL